MVEIAVTHPVAETTRVIFLRALTGTLSRYAWPRDLGYDISRSQQRTEGHCHGGDRRGHWGATRSAGNRRSACGVEWGRGGRTSPDGGPDRGDGRERGRRTGRRERRGCFGGGGDAGFGPGAGRGGAASAGRVRRGPAGRRRVRRAKPGGAHRPDACGPGRSAR